MIYFSDAPVVLSSVDETQYNALRKFRKELEKRGLVDSYSDHAELTGNCIGSSAKRSFPSSLRKIQTRELKTKIRNFLKPTFRPNSCGANRFERRCHRYLGGSWQRSRHDRLDGKGSGGNHIQVNNTVLDTSTPRLSARYEAAIEQLADVGYIAAVGYKGEMFSVTDLGYKLLDALGLSGG